MKSAITLIVSLLYFFTAQLTVHAFSMHGGTHHHNHSHTKHHCGDTDTNSQKNNHDMSLCLEQSMGAFIEYTPYTVHSKVDYVYIQQDRLSIIHKANQQYSYSFHDPGWGENGNFSIFLDQLYGHGIIMHC